MPALNLSQDTHIQVKTSLNCKGRILDLSTAKVMAILNLTPDSFHDGAKFSGAEAALKQTQKLLDEGADIIDLGAQSTRPGATFINAEEEWQRLEKILPALTAAFPDALFSIDTFHASVASRAVAQGVCMVNDVSGGQYDPAMFKTVAALGVPYVLMHVQGRPADMQQNPVYTDVVNEVLDYFTARIHQLLQLGVKDIVLDPGFGFGKSTVHNYLLLKNLGIFRMTGLPVLAGISRKSMVCKPLGITPEQALNGSTALHMLALQAGASLLRVHDVKEARECIQLYAQWKAV